jgi:acyl carrier protein
MQDITSRLRDYIIEKHLPGERPSNLKDETRLQSSGILDSFAVLDLASFIHAEFGVELSASDTTAESFDRLKDISALIKRQSGSLPIAS